MANERIPVVGHLGLVPRHDLDNYRATARPPPRLGSFTWQMKELESAGAYAAELEVVPHQLASRSSQT